MAEQRGNNNAMYVAVILVLGAIAIVWTMVGLGGPSQAPLEEEPPEPAAAAEPEPVAAEAEAEPTPRVRENAKPPDEQPSPSVQEDRYIDLFAGDQPDFMAKAHARVLDGKWLHVSVQKELYNWGQEHPDDARPQLLLAYDSINREWDGMAVRVYKMAYDADPRAKYDPNMLKDLLEVAATHGKVEHRESRDLIVEAYGEEALPKLDEKLEDLRSRHVDEQVERLEAVRAAITGG